MLSEARCGLWLAGFIDVPTQERGERYIKCGVLLAMLDFVRPSFLNFRHQLLQIFTGQARWK